MKKKHEDVILTIIIPAHNVGGTIQRCVNSILAQNITELEVIIVENASTDNTLDVCNQIAESDSRVIVYHTDQSGTSKARNIGLIHARGTIIGFCDADDYMEKLDVDEILCYFKEEKTDVLVFGYNHVDMNGNIIRSNIENEICIDSSEALIENVLFNEKIMGSVWNKLFRAEILKDMYFDERLSYCEDTHFVVKVLSSDKDLEVRYIPKIFYNYVNDVNSVTNNLKNVFDGEKIKYIQAMEQIREDCTLSDKNLGILNLKIVYFCMEMFSVLIKNPGMEPEKRKVRFEYIYDYIEKYRKEYFSSDQIGIKLKVKLMFVLIIRKLKLERLISRAVEVYKRLA